MIFFVKITFYLIYQDCEPVSHPWLQYNAPDVVFHNTITSSLFVFEQMCPLDSNHHLSQPRSRKQSKVEYQQILAELHPV